MEHDTSLLQRGEIQNPLNDYQGMFVVLGQKLLKNKLARPGQKGLQIIR